jgi:hypothetical protein
MWHMTVAQDRKTPGGRLADGCNALLVSKTWSSQPVRFIFIFTEFQCRWRRKGCVAPDRGDKQAPQKIAASFPGGFFLA